MKLSNSGFTHVLMGDSITGDTKIIINGGLEVPIESLFEGREIHRQGDKEYCIPGGDAMTYNPITGKNEYRPIKYAMRHYTSKPIYRVWLNNSNWLDVTEDHSLMGYVNTQQRRKGEASIVEVAPQDIGTHVRSLVMAKRIPYTETAPRYDELFCTLLGYIVGDGCLEPAGVMLSVGQSDMAEITDRLLDPLVAAGHITGYRVRPNHHDVRLKGPGLRERVEEALYSGPQKEIPEWLLNQPESHIAAFLTGLFTADGTVTDKGGVIRLTTVVDGYVSMVRKLLFRVGIASTWFTETSENHYDGVYSGTFSKHVVVKSRDEFGDRVGFLLDRKNVRILPESTKTKSIGIGSDVALWAPLRVERLPDTDQFVYDIEVDDTHTFYANYMLVHNTDSSYVRLDLHAEKHGIEQNAENMVALADRLQRRLETELPDILSKKFLSSPSDLKILKPGRENVGRKALFKDKKKRYAIHVVHSGKFAADKIKVMGMETRRSDTPAFIQAFLSECIELVIKHDKTYDEVRASVDEFRKVFRAMPPWEQVSPGRVKNLGTHTRAYEIYESELENGSYVDKLDQMHFTVKAALNTNRLMDHYGETRWDRIHDGDKVGVIYLLPNPEQMDAVAIRTGELYIPDWFQRLPFDVDRMEEKLLDKKLFNVVGDVLGWDFTPPKNYSDDITQDMDDFYD